MNELHPHSRRPAGPPPEVLEALAHERAADRAALVETWHLAGHYLRPEPDEAAFRRLGVEIWDHLEAALQAEAPAPPPARPAHAPLRLVRLQTVRRLALAACVALLVGVGLFLWQQPVTVTAPYGQTAGLELPDGSDVVLNSGATLRYRRSFGEAARTVTLDGEAFFAVTTDEAPFVVQTFNGAVTVLGTQFNVRAWPDDLDPATDVAVLSGRVRLAARHAATQALTLGAGESARLFARSDAPVALDEVGLDNALAWRNGGFKFSNHPLGTVTRELARRYAVRVEVTPKSLLDKPVAILKENPLGAEEILRDICEYNGYAYRAIPGGYEIYQPDAE